MTGGNGGGKPDFAMAGAKDQTKLDEALAAVPGLVREQMQ
jgi:alanyl-tRNA synthetase